MPTSQFGCTETIYVICYCLCSLLFTAIFTGWPQLQLILLGEGQFQELCSANKHSCPSQLEHLALLYTMTVGTFCACMLPAGIAIDKGKLGATWIMGMLLQVPALALLGYADSVTFDVYLPCLVAQAGGAAIVFLCLVPMSQVFVNPTTQHRVLLLAVVMYHTASATFTTFYELHSVVHLPRKTFFVGLSLSAFVLLTVTGCLYRKLQRKVEIIECEMDVIPPSTRTEGDLTSTIPPPAADGPFGSPVSKNTEKTRNGRTLSPQSFLADSPSYFHDNPPAPVTPRDTRKSKHLPRHISPHPFEISDSESECYSEVSSVVLLNNNNSNHTSGNHKHSGRRRKKRRVVRDIYDLRELEVSEQLQTPIFIVLGLIAPLLISRNFVYIGFSRDMLEQMGTANFNFIHLRVFSYLLVTAAFLGPFVGSVLRVFGFGWCMHIVNGLTLVSTLITVIQNVDVQYIAIVIFTVTRPLTFAVLGATVSHIFGNKTSGRIQGVLFGVTSLVLLLLYGGLRVMFERMNGDFVWVNGMYAGSEILCIVLIEWARRWITSPATAETRMNTPTKAESESKAEEDRVSDSIMTDGDFDINPTFGAVSRLMMINDDHL